jgi:hypothetical protein
MTRNPGDDITAWVVIDHETIITGDDDGNYYKTDRYGRRTWATDVINLAGNDITDLALSPSYVTDGTVLAGDDSSLVYISMDEGDSWEELSASDLNLLMVHAPGPTYVAFDPGYASNNFVYAASDDVVARCEIDGALDMDEQAFTNFALAATPPTLTAHVGPGGMVVAPDGTMYVADADDAAGVWRCLNPMDDLALVLFEQVTVGLGTDENFTGLGVYGYVRNLELSTGSNILWAIDTDIGNDSIWSYEDTLVGPVMPQSPGDGAFLNFTDRVEFNWSDLNALTVAQYDLEVYTEQDWLDGAAAAPNGMADVTAFSEYIWVTADPGTTYVWRVRVSMGQPVASRWSAERTFTTMVGQTAAPVGVRPLPGAEGVIRLPTFDWLPIAGATFYEIEVADNADFSPLLTSGTSTVNAWVIDTQLEYSTAYYWRVRGVSSTGAPAGAWILSVFTTMAEPEEAPPPVVIEPTEPVTPEVVIPPATPITPGWIYAIIAVGAALAIAVIVLIVRTRRVP